jgi:MarR family transcriptional regulator, organic hydroperoxide resistance regulator
VTTVDDGELIRLLLQTASALSGRVTGTLQDLSLTAPAAAALWTLPGDGSGLPLKELSARLGCDRSNATLLSERLEAAGLAKRAVHPSDKRVRVLALSKAGQRAREELMSSIAAQSGIGQITPAERQALGEILTRLNSAAQD